jgi:hypothetical protein
MCAHAAIALQRLSLGGRTRTGVGLSLPKLGEAKTEPGFLRLALECMKTKS